MHRRLGRRQVTHHRDLSHVDTAAGTFDYELKPARALISIDKVVKEIESNLPDEPRPRLRGLRHAAAACVKVGGTFDCTISRGGKPLGVRVTVESVDGVVNVELSPKGRTDPRSPPVESATP